MHSMATLQPSGEGRSSSTSRASITAEGKWIQSEFIDLSISLINCSVITGIEATTYKEWREHNALHGDSTTRCRGAVH